VPGGSDYLKAILLPAADQAGRKALLAEATREYSGAAEWKQ